MSFSIALKFIYRPGFARDKKDQCYCLPWNKVHSRMLEQIKSKLCESCHSLLCSPHPCHASDGEKLSFFFLNTRIVPPDILFMGMETAQLLVDGDVRQRGKSVNWPNVFVWCNIYAALLGAEAFMLLFHCFSVDGPRAWTPL